MRKFSYSFTLNFYLKATKTYESKFKSNTALDILKICLAFMVVAMHTGFLSDISKTVSYFLNEGIFRIAVPIFLIINGYYFGAILEKKRTSNWFKRVLVLYAIWMLIYAY